MDIAGTVFDIKKFAIHDGPGIRTTVFLKGCPLTCLWCHNPESQDEDPEISFLPAKCIRCGYCVDICPNHSHSLTEDGHFFSRGNCEKCGKCSEECYAEALELIGKEMTVSEALAEVLKDQAFYETSGGGMTVSGGEPMLQFEFTKALVEAAKAEGLHVCLDTCGFAPFDKYSQLLDSVDIFLYDLKETDPEKHKEFTGVPLQLILENLKRIDGAGGKIILRCPIIPGLNDREEHFLEIAKIANGLSNIIAINIQPYHPLGSSKNARIGKEYGLDGKPFAEEEAVEGWLKAIREHTDFPVDKG